MCNADASSSFDPYWGGFLHLLFHHKVSLLKVFFVLIVNDVHWTSFKTILPSSALEVESCLGSLIVLSLLTFPLLLINSICFNFVHSRYPKWIFVIFSLDGLATSSLNCSQAQTFNFCLPGWQSLHLIQAYLSQWVSWWPEPPPQVPNWNTGRQSKGMR